METWIDRQTVFEGKLVRVEKGRVRLEDGREAEREVVHHAGSVGMVPVQAGEAIFVRQFRIALGRDILEIPAGKLETGELPEHRAQVELAEEIGFEAGRLVPAGRMLPSVGFLDEALYLYLAFDLIPATRDPDPDEDIEIVRMPLETVRAKLREHAFEDAKTRVGLHALFDHLADESGGP